MPRPVQQHDGQILHLHVHGEGDASKVVLRRVADVDGAASLRSDGDLVHIGDRGRRKNATDLGGDGDAQRLTQTPRDEADAVHWEHREVDSVPPHPDATLRHQPVVGTVRADHDAAVERHAGKRLLHHALAGVAGA